MRQVQWGGKTVAVDIHPAAEQAVRRAGNALTLQLKLLLG